VITAGAIAIWVINSGRPRAGVGNPLEGIQSATWYLTTGLTQLVSHKRERSTDHPVAAGAST